MDTVEYSWGAAASNQHNLVSSLDLLEEEILRETTKSTLQQTHEQQLIVEGEPAATIPRELTKTSPRKPTVASKSARKRPSTSRGGGRSANNENEAEDGVKRKLQLENETLQREVMQWRREVEHARDEKHELEASFRRLDQEIGNGYHLAERKEKELRIAELVTKNQKMSQLMEKELHSHEDLRRAHAELQGEYRKLNDQVTLLNQVVDSVETKHAALSSTHATLTASYEAAQVVIEKLQGEVHTLQDKLAHSDTHTQLVAEYEEKIRNWERTYREMERKCDHNNQKLAQTQQIANVTRQENEQTLQRQVELEQELRNAHDLIIRTNAAMRTMEAKLKTNLKSAQYGGNNEALKRRIQHLEGEVLEKNRLNTELMQTYNQLLGPRKRSSISKPLSARNGHAVATKVAKLTTQIASLTEKLHSTEEARDHNSRSLHVLLQALPFLMHRLNALQDRYAAAVESNDILKSAIEQMQDPPLDTSWNKPGANNYSHLSSSMSASTYLSLAREKYLLEAPYPIELLAEQAGAQAFSGCPETGALLTAAKKKKRFSPFRVTSSPMKLKDNQHDEEHDDQTHQLVMLAVDPNDVSGASYLNRSKINAFLEIIQSRAARKKFKTLLIGKLADCLNKLRELAHRSASESAAQNATIQMLQHDVADLQQKLKNSQKNSDDNGLDDVAGATMESATICKIRNFLLKVVDIYAEKQQQDDHRQMTFLTQPFSSDLLITQAQENTKHGSPDDILCLSNCNLDDDDVSQLLLKVLVSGVRFREIMLDSNNFSDAGAQHIADFLEKCPPNLRVMSLTCNKRITKDGVGLIRRGLIRNQRVQRVDEVGSKSPKELILRGLAIQQDFDVSGEGTEILRVVLPVAAQPDEPQRDSTMIHESVDALTEKLRQLGFTYNVRQPSGSSRPRSAPKPAKTESILVVARVVLEVPQLQPNPGRCRFPVVAEPISQQVASVN